MSYDASILLLEPYKHRFRNRTELTFIDAGQSGVVYRLGRERLALKIARTPFSYGSGSTDKEQFKPYEPDTIPSRLEGIHHALRYDPFLVECRAYGQMIKDKMNGVILTACHGWVNIPPSIHRKIAVELGLKGIWMGAPSAGCQPLRGILLDYIEGPPLDPTCLRREDYDLMQHHVETLHCHHIIHGDLRISNIKVASVHGLKLFDLGSSMTFPHPTFSDSRNAEREFEKRKRIDFEDLREIGELMHVSSNKMDPRCSILAREGENWAECGTKCAMRKSNYPVP